MFHQDGVVLDRDAQLLPAPLGNRRVGEELEREHVLQMQREGALEGLPRGHRRADVVPRVPHRVEAVGDVGLVVVVRRVEGDDAVAGGLERGIHRRHRLFRRAPRLDGRLDDVARGNRLREGIADALRRLRFPGLQHVGYALHVGAEVHELHAPVDHHHVAGLDDAGGGGGDDAFGPGHVDRRHVELAAEGPFEQPVLQPPRHVFEGGLAGRNHLVRQRPFGQADGDAGRFAEGHDLRGHAARAELRHELLGAHEARGIGLAERLHEVIAHGHGEAVGRTDLLRHVDADALRVALAHELRQHRGRRHAVVGAGFVDEVAARPEGDALHAVAAQEEHVVAHAGDVAAAEVFPQRIDVVLLHRDEPHVDVVVLHRQRQDLLELVEADLALHLPAPPRFLGAGLGCDRQADGQGRHALPHPRHSTVLRRYEALTVSHWPGPPATRATAGLAGA